MSIVEEMEKLLEERNLQLYPDLFFEDDGGRNKLFLCDDSADSSDTYFLYETYSTEDMYNFLKRENIIEIANTRKEKKG